MTSSAPYDIGSLIESRPGVYGGQPCLAGTRFPVLQVAAEYAAGATANDIVDRYEGLELVKVHAAIAYYLANRPALDELLERRTGQNLREAGVDSTFGTV